MFDRRRLRCGTFGISMNQYMDYGRVAVEGTTTESEGFTTLQTILNENMPPDTATNTAARSHGTDRLQDFMQVPGGTAPIARTAQRALACELDPAQCVSGSTGFEDGVHAGSCFECHNDCELCSGPGPANCTKCKPNYKPCLLYTSPSPRDATLSRMPSSA